MGLTYNLFFQGLNNNKYHTFDVLHHLMIPKPENAIAACLQIPGPFGIVLFLLQMLAAVQFEDEFLARRAEINHILSNCMLIPKVSAFKPMST